MKGIRFSQAFIRSRASIRSISDSCQITKFSPTFVLSPGPSKSDTVSLPFQIVNALYLGERDKAFNILLTITRKNIPLTADDFVYILDYCAKSPDPLFVMETWRIMEEKEISLNKICHILIIQTLTKGGYLEEAFNWLSSLRQSYNSAPDLDMYNTFLSECIRRGSIVHARSCLDLMENQMVGKSEKTYSELLKLAVLEKNVSAIHEVWKQFNNYYCPNIIFLQKVIGSFTRLGDLFSAYEALQHAVVLVFKRSTSDRLTVEGKIGRSRLDIPILSPPWKCRMPLPGGGLTRPIEDDVKEKEVYDLVECPKENRTFVEAGTGFRNLNFLSVSNQDSYLGVMRTEFENQSSDVVKRGSTPILALDTLRWSFNNVILACSKTRNCKLAEQLFQQMQKIGLKPSNLTYDGLIRTVVYDRGVAHGLKLLKAMEDMDLKPCDSTLATLSLECSKNFELDEAEALLDRVVDTPHLCPFNALFAAYDVKDQPERAVKILARMKQLKLKPDVRTYEILFSLFGKVDAPYGVWNTQSQVDTGKRIKAIQMDMVKNEVQHNPLSFLNLIRALGAAGWTHKLFWYFHTLENQLLYTNSFQGTAIYNSVFYFLVEAGKCNKALDVFKYMKMRDVSPNAETYNIMIDCCGVLGCFKSACVFVSMMLRDGFHPQKCTYRALLKVLLKANCFDEALELMYQMSSEGIQPDVVFFNNILHKAHREKRIDIIEHIVEQMHRQRIHPDPSTCRLVFLTYFNSQYESTAMEALQVLSMRMISEEEGLLQEKSQYYEDNFIFSEDSEAESRAVELFEGSGDYLAIALLNLRWCAISGCSISWSPDQSEWAKKLSISYTETLKASDGVLVKLRAVHPRVFPTKGLWNRHYGLWNRCQGLRRKAPWIKSCTHRHHLKKLRTGVKISRRHVNKRETFINKGRKVKQVVKMLTNQRNKNKKVNRMHKALANTGLWGG